jgi:hypothetical protein
MKTLKIRTTYRNHVHLHLRHKSFAPNVHAPIRTDTGRLSIFKAVPSKPLGSHLFSLMS